jgi:hypothetical protein
LGNARNFQLEDIRQVVDDLFPWSEEILAAGRHDMNTSNGVCELARAKVRLTMRICDRRRVCGMTKTHLNSVSFKLYRKKCGRFRLTRKPKGGPKPWNAKRAIMIWSILFSAYGSATATMQYPWIAGSELLRAVIFQGSGAGLTAAAMAAFICVAHNRKLNAQHVKPVRSRLSGAK